MSRKYTRLHIPLEVEMDFSSGAREARISDLSIGGCFVDSILNVDEGERVSFIIRLSAQESLSLSGDIVYSMPGIGFGIRFDELTEEQRFHLEHLILKHGGSTAEATE